MKCSGPLLLLLLLNDEPSPLMLDGGKAIATSYVATAVTVVTKAPDSTSDHPSARPLIHIWMCTVWYGIAPAQSSGSVSVSVSASASRATPTGAAYRGRTVP